MDSYLQFRKENELGPIGPLGYSRPYTRPGAPLIARELVFEMAACDQLEVGVGRLTVGAARITSGDMINEIIARKLIRRHLTAEPFECSKS